MLFISELRAKELGRKLVAEGKAKSFTVVFTRQRCADTREVEAGYKLIVR